MRVLVTVEPRMYREALALALHGHRPCDEVMLAPPGAVDGRLAGFAPDLLVRNDTDGASPGALDGAARVEVLYGDGTDAGVVAGGRAREARDMSIDDLLRVADEVGASVPGESPPTGPWGRPGRRRAGLSSPPSPTPPAGRPR